MKSEKAAGIRAFDSVGPAEVQTVAYTPCSMNPALVAMIRILYLIPILLA